MEANGSGTAAAKETMAMGSSMERCGAGRGFERWHNLKRALRAAALVGVGLAAAWPARAADVFTKPTKQELEMTELPGYPGAPAVVLYRDEVSKDDLHVFQHYERIKVLTEDGKKYANVELPYFSSLDNGWDVGDNKKIGDIVGRTIHADGTIIPFTGKPYLKTIEKGQDFKVQEMIFTLPDVEVGSIIEYRYATRYNDGVYESPTWLIQGDLYLKAAHYAWFPTTHDMVEGETGNMVTSITWFPVLPPSAKIVHTEMPAGGPTADGPMQIYDLVIKDVPPEAHEEYMPPVANLSYRVYFNFSSFRTPADFWKTNGKMWSKRVNNFAGPDSALTKATSDIVAGATTPDEKLHKIYAAVMALENTEFTRDRDRREDKAAGLGKVKEAVDVLEHKRGTPSQITEVFIGMARAAGFKAYAMVVPDRSRELFMQGWLNMSQFDDLIAIVNVDGKDMFFDPGSRYCAYGHLAWEHTFLPSGMRQTDDGTDFVQTPGDGYSVNRQTRVANLSLDAEGQVTGKIDLKFYGAPALRWREAALRGDEESLHHQMQKHLEEMIPKGLEVKVTDVQNLDDPDKPLAVTFSIKGTMGTSAGKRIVMPADLFMAGSSTTFPHEKRDSAVYFHYEQMVQDALQLKLPTNLAVEAVPADAKFKIPNEAVYDFSVTQTTNGFVTRRNFVFGGIVVPVTEYPGLRTFYSQFEGKDQESVVLKPTPVSATAAAQPGSGR
jgi:hypothetical protein